MDGQTEEVESSRPRAVDLTPTENGRVTASGESSSPLQGINRPVPQLFVAERDYGIDTHGAAGWDVTGG